MQKVTIKLAPSATVCIQPMPCYAYIATSLDGFIARPDGGLDWLDAAQARITPPEDCGYAAFMQGMDALVMGRNTYEKVRSFTPWPYDKPVYVLSRTLQALPDAPAGVQLFHGTPAELLAHAEQQGQPRLYVDGGLTVQSFIAAGLLDEITITRIPVLLGEGLPLFGPLHAGHTEVALHHIGTRSWDFGLVQSRYALKNKRV